jgi:hypothetical protein
MELSERTGYVFRVIRSLLLAMAATGLIVLIWKVLRERFPQLPDVKLETVLAFLAIGFATVQFFDSKRQEREMKDIARSMSTRFVGCFPKNLKEITDTVTKASAYLYIIVDFVGYAQYSAPEEHSRYLRAVEEALSRGADVKFIVYDKTVGDRELAEQIPDHDNWFAKEAGSPRFNRFFEINKGISRSASGSALRQLLVEQQERSRGVLCTKGAEVGAFSESAAFFLWLEDDEEAVCAFKNVGNTERGLSFKTQDANLIRQFKDIFERRWKKLQDECAAAASSAQVTHAANPPTAVKKEQNIESIDQPGSKDKRAATIAQDTEGGNIAQAGREDKNPVPITQGTIDKAAS